jgi:hypothetical protein
MASWDFEVEAVQWEPHNGEKTPDTYQIVAIDEAGYRFIHEHHYPTRHEANKAMVGFARTPGFRAEYGKNGWFYGGETEGSHAWYMTHDRDYRMGVEQGQEYEAELDAHDIDTAEEAGETLRWNYQCEQASV